MNYKESGFPGNPERSTTRDILQRLNTMVEITAMSYGERRGKGTKINEELEPFVYVGLIDDDWTAYPILQKAKLFDLGKTQQELRRVYGGGVSLEHISLYAERVLKYPAATLSDEKYTTINAGLRFVLDSPTEKTVTDEGYEGFKFLNSAHMTLSLMVGGNLTEQAFMTGHLYIPGYDERQTLQAVSADQLQTFYDMLSPHVIERIRENFEANDRFDEWLTSLQGKDWLEYINGNNKS